MSERRRSTVRAARGGLIAGGLPARLAVVLAIVLAVVLAGCSNSGTPQGAATSPSAPGSSTATSGAADAPKPPQVPSTGALVGAWTRPTTFTASGRTAAVLALEQKLGGRLDIVHTYRLWNEPLLSQSEEFFLRRGTMLLLSWATPDLRSVTAGQYDSYITAAARQVAQTRKPLFLQFRWEMNRPNLRDVVGSPADFVAAWKHTRRIFQQQGASNAAWVWCPLGNNFSVTDAPAYYPGDDVVDWTCVDVYPGKDLKPMSQLLEPFLAWAKDHPKPVMIGEFGVGRHVSPQRRAQWLAQTAQTVQDTPQIKAVLYFDANPSARQPDREYKIGDDAAAVAEFRRIASSSYFNVLGQRTSAGG